MSASAPTALSCDSRRNAPNDDGDALRFAGGGGRHVSLDAVEGCNYSGIRDGTRKVTVDGWLNDKESW